MTPVEKQKVDPVLKLFFLLVVLSGLFTVLYHPVIAPKYPEFAKKYDALRRVPTGSDLLPFEKQGTHSLTDKQNTLKLSMTEAPLYVLFRTNASRKYIFSATMSDGMESVTANLYSGEAPLQEKKPIATTLTAKHVSGMPNRSQSEELYEAPRVEFPHDQYEYAFLDSGEVYTLETLHEDKASIGKEVIVSVAFKDRGYEVVQVWGAFAGLLLFLYILRIGLLFLRMGKMKR